MPIREIEELKQCFVKQMLPVQIYLFGSYANQTYTADCCSSPKKSGLELKQVRRQELMQRP